MKVLVIQNSVKQTVQENIEHVQSILKNINENHLDFIVFPEMFTTPYEMQYFKKNKQTADGIVAQFLKETSKHFNAYVIGGSLPETEKNKLYNSSLIYNRDGQLIAKYRKIKLFEVTYPNGQTFKESDTLSAGKDTIVFDTEFGKMGVMICFDIRFPLMTRVIRKTGAKAIFVPAAFNTFTGPLHWRTTFRARAIDNQLFMIGASPSTDSYGHYQPYGHSLIVNPLGEVIKELNEKEGYFVVDIDLSEIERARTSIPIVKLDH